MKRVKIAVVAAVTGATIVGGISWAGPRHDARCAGLHARSAAFQQAANNTTDPELKARYQRRADNLDKAADRCDAAGATTSTT